MRGVELKVRAKCVVDLADCKVLEHHLVGGVLGGNEEASPPLLNWALGPELRASPVKEGHKARGYDRWEARSAELRSSDGEMGALDHVPVVADNEVCVGRALNPGRRGGGARGRRGRGGPAQGVRIHDADSPWREGEVMEKKGGETM